VGDDGVAREPQRIEQACARPSLGRQPGLTNAIQHGDPAGLIEIRLIADDVVVRVEVLDDGAGTAPRPAPFASIAM